MAGRPAIFRSASPATRKRPGGERAVNARVLGCRGCAQCPGGTTPSSTGFTSPTTRWSRRAMAASNIGSPMSERCCRVRGLHSARCRLRLYGHLPSHGDGRTGPGRQRCPHRARCLSGPTDPGQGDLHRLASAVHAQDGRDPDRTRQAHVPVRIRIDPDCRAPTAMPCAAACRAWPMSGSPPMSPGPDGCKARPCHDRHRPMVARLDDVSHRYRRVALAGGHDRHSSRQSSRIDRGPTAWANPRCSG